MRTATHLLAVAGTAALLSAGPALAHPGHGDMGLASGLTHPLTGPDHILAMVAVGLLAAGRGGSSLLLWPASFILAMLAGYARGLLEPSVWPAEPAILASVVVLGALAASSFNVPVSAGVALIAGFGFCHGFAHGAEAPTGAGASYPLGFAASTALLHAAGLGLGLMALRVRRPGLLRLLGGGVAVGGFAMAVIG